MLQVDKCNSGKIIDGCVNDRVRSLCRRVEDTIFTLGTDPMGGYYDNWNTFNERCCVLDHIFVELLETIYIFKSKSCFSCIDDLVLNDLIIFIREYLDSINPHWFNALDYDASERVNKAKKRVLKQIY